MAQAQKDIRNQLPNERKATGPVDVTTAGNDSGPKKRSTKRNKSERNWQQKKKQPPRPNKRPNDIFITNKSHFKGQEKQCENLLNSGYESIYLHCIGNAITRGMNLALTLLNKYENLRYSINTSTIELLDEFHPLNDEDDLTLEKRNNSAIHIEISRKLLPEVEKFTNVRK